MLAFDARGYAADTLDTGHRCAAELHYDTRHGWLLVSCPWERWACLIGATDAERNKSYD
jgi:hypothetical protein